MLTQLGAGVYRLGDDIVNSYVFVDGGDVTIVDAGVPAYWGDLPTALGSIGRSVGDVRALLLTHGHSDHIGFAEKARRAAISVRVHELDAALARGEVPNPARGVGAWKIGPVVRFLLWGVRHGSLGQLKLAAVETFGDGATLDLPGSPKVVLVPGHTPGSAAVHFAAHDALCVGDALATYAVTTGRRGPQLAPFTADAATAVASLARLEGINAALTLPGHGAEWRAGPRAAIQLVRERAATAA